jgi:hypothetical protein
MRVFFFNFLFVDVIMAALVIVIGNRERRGTIDRGAENVNVVVVVLRCLVNTIVQKGRT